MSRLRSTGIFVASAALATACSSYHIVSDAQESELRSRPLSSERNAPDPELYADALCKFYEKCSPIVLLSAGKGAECRKTMGRATARALNARGNTVTAADLNACLEKLGRTCDDSLYTLDECAFEGTLEDGEACNFSGQCASANCSLDSREPGGCGKCAPRTQLPSKSNSSAAPLKLGATCTAGDQDPCDQSAGLWCTRANATSTTGTCQRYGTANVGEACQLGGAERIYCVQSWCQLPTGKDRGTCRKNKAINEMVEEGEQCAFGLVAKDGMCVDSKPESCD